MSDNQFTIHDRLDSIMESINLIQVPAIWLEYDKAACNLSKPMDEELSSMIRQQNVLVNDDVTTSGSTLNEILRILRILNEGNEIAIFSLIGRKDLMADSF